MPRVLKPWVGQPDKDGRLVACAQCGRVAVMTIQGEPRCTWHVTGKLGGDGLRAARANREAKKRRLS